MIKNSMVPLYQQLSDEIKKQIVEGKLQAGDKLPTEASSARRLRSAGSPCAKRLSCWWMTVL